MATAKDTSTFFLEADAKEFDSVLKLYPQAIKLKAEQKTKKPEELIKLDNWYQNELPKKIKARGKDAHMIHEELVQLMKWKQARGKFYPQLSYLIKVNTPRAVMQETKKAFRKLPNIESAMTALSNLKGVGTATASALLAAASPEIAPFMADECVQAIPEMEGSDYTAKEYLNFVNHIRTVCDRLNKEQNGCGKKWSPHMVELTLWTHNIVSDLRPELLGKNPNITAQPTNGGSPLPSDESNLEPPSTNGNGKLADSVNEDTTTSCTEDSMDAKATSPATPPSPSDNSDSAVSTPSAKSMNAFLQNNITSLGAGGEVHQQARRVINNVLTFLNEIKEDPQKLQEIAFSKPHDLAAMVCGVSLSTVATIKDECKNSEPSSPQESLKIKRPLEEASSAEENSLGDSSDAPAPPVAKKLREATH